MNNYLTYTAAAKLLKLMDINGSYSVAINAANNMFEFDWLREEPSERFVMISAFPKVFTDLKSLRLMKDQAIDFDYNSNSFIFSL